MKVRFEQRLVDLTCSGKKPVAAIWLDSDSIVKIEQLNHCDEPEGPMSVVTSLPNLVFTTVLGSPDEVAKKLGWTATIVEQDNEHAVIPKTVLEDTISVLKKLSDTALGNAVYFRSNRQIYSVLSDLAGQLEEYA